MSARTISLAELTAYLDGYLHTAEIPDDPNALNGLQVENAGQVRRIVAAVDASQQTIDRAVEGPGPTLVVVHHGLFWDGHRPMTGRRYRRIATLLRHDAALYASHLPLDLHPEVGNNAVLAHRLGLTGAESFGNYKGAAIGVAGNAPEPIQSREALVEAVGRALGTPSSAIRLIPGGPERIARVGVITGAGGSMIGQAMQAGCDTFITGEGAAHTYFDATEWGINLIYAGHYATETVGVRALAEHLAGRYGLPWEFHDHPTGL
jgi:dinuclear metal center YbgI/SA1388 family protein